jgi:integrase-like protein
VHIDVRPGQGWRRLARTRPQIALQRHLPGSRRQTATHRRLGVRAHRGRRLQPPRLPASAIGFLRRAIAFYRRHGIEVERILTDNGSAHRAVIHAVVCRQLGIRHIRIRPYRPQTNGRAERFIRTLLNGWAYSAIYGSSQERTRAFDGWLCTTTIADNTQPSAANPGQQNQPARVGPTPRRQ